MEPDHSRKNGSGSPHFPGPHRGQKGRFVPLFDAAVRRRVLDLTVAEIKERNAGQDQQEILELIEDEVDAARADRH